MNVNDSPNLSPARPYMVRAIHEWLEDNLLTPYLQVDATHKHAKVPNEYVQDGCIVLNISNQATGNLQMDNDFIHFSARFGGVSQEIWVPMPAVMGIFAKENSQGMFFDPKEYENYTPELDETEQETSKQTKITKERPKRKNTAGLKIVK